MIRLNCGFLLIVITTLISLSHQQVKADLFPLSIIHINDFHARFEPTDIYGGTCDDGQNCIGGYARTVYTVKRLLQEQKHTNAVYFNAGDSFQGTLWYNIGRWNVTSQFLNMLPADAMTLGNHEFDHGVEGLVPFLEALNTTMLVANMDSKNEPELTGKYKKSMIIERNNRKIGIIGVILETTYDLANTGNLIFRNESEVIVEEAKKLKVQGANIIIVISHCGYEVDKEIARHAGSEIDIIVGSHSHTFLYTGDNPPGPDKPGGDYPTQITHSSGHCVLIVQAGAYAKYVGNLTVYFDDKGDVVDFEGAPIYMNNNVPQDGRVSEALKPWRHKIDVLGNRVIGRSVVHLQQKECSTGECNLGNFVTDAMLYAFLEEQNYDSPNWSNITIAFTAQSHFRVPLEAGNLTYKHLITMCPWENDIFVVTLNGSSIHQLLEECIAPLTLKSNYSYRFPQVSGLKIVFNITNPVGQRIQELKARSSSFALPKYVQLDGNKDYKIVVMDYLAHGKDGFNIIKDNAKDLRRGPKDLDTLIKFIQMNDPVTTGIEGRIKIVR